MYIRFFYQLLTLSLFFLSMSCSESKDMDALFNGGKMDTRTVDNYSCTTQKEANYLLAHNLELNGSQYYLNISKGEASLLGVPEDFFDNAMNEIQQVNEKIEELKKDSVSVTLFDPQQELINSRMISYCAPSGVLRTNSGAVQSEFYEVREGVKGIEFNCRPNASILTLVVCGVYCMGQWMSQSGTASIFSNAIIKVLLLATNTTVSMRFETMDANGGVAAFQGYKES